MHQPWDCWRGACPRCRPAWRPRTPLSTIVRDMTDNEKPIRLGAVRGDPVGAGGPPGAEGRRSGRNGPRTGHEGHQGPQRPAPAGAGLAAVATRWTPRMPARSLPRSPRPWARPKYQRPVSVDVEPVGGCGAARAQGCRAGRCRPRPGHEGYDGPVRLVATGGGPCRRWWPARSPGMPPPQLSRPSGTTITHSFCRRWRRACRRWPRAWSPGMPRRPPPASFNSSRTRRTPAPCLRWCRACRRWPPAWNPRTRRRSVAASFNSSRTPRIAEPCLRWCRACRRWWPAWNPRTPPRSLPPSSRPSWTPRTPTPCPGDGLVGGGCSRGGQGRRANRYHLRPGHEGTGPNALRAAGAVCGGGPPGRQRRMTGGHHLRAGHQSEQESRGLVLGGAPGGGGGPAWTRGMPGRWLPCSPRLVEDSKEPTSLSWLARGLSAVAARLEPRDAAAVSVPVATTLTQAVKDTSDPAPWGSWCRVCPPWHPAWESRDASAGCCRARPGHSRPSKDPMTLYWRVALCRRWRLACPPRRPWRSAAPVATILTQCIKDTRESSALLELAQAVSALAGSLGARECRAAG